MSISHILQSGLAEARSAGAKQVGLGHLPEGGADELANETLAFLRSRPGRPSSVTGWTAVSPSNAGVIAWWADQAGLTKETQRRSLRDLRRQTYDLLDERGLIVKPVGPSAVVNVSPAPVIETEAADASTAEPADAAPATAAPATADAPTAKADKATKTTKATRAAKAAKAAKTAKTEGAKAKTAKAEGAKAKARTAKAKPAKVAKATAEPAAASGAADAWILRLDPTVWNLARFMADGHREVSAWAVEDNERSASMTRGQRVFLWAGGDGTLIMAGVWGAGWVVGPCQSKSIADGYWVDPAGNNQRRLFADVSIQFLVHPVDRQAIANDPRLAAIEVLRDPFVSNPSRLTPDESAAMVALLGLDPAAEPV